jgi:hypothetical protein
MGETVGFRRVFKETTMNGLAIFVLLAFLAGGVSAQGQSLHDGAPAALARLGVALPIVDVSAQPSSPELRTAIQQRLVQMLTAPDVQPIPLRSTTDADLRREVSEHRLQIVLVVTLSNQRPATPPTGMTLTEPPPAGSNGIDPNRVSVEFRLNALPNLAPRLWFARQSEARRVDDEALTPVLEGMVQTLTEVLLGPK